MQYTVIYERSLLKMYISSVCVRVDDDANACALRRHEIPLTENIQGVFTSRANQKYFLFHSSHRIFGRMHGALNVGKKDN
jgi:hypothetical protein